MTENEYLELPWSVEDTIENLETIKEIMIAKVRAVNLDGKAKSDVEEIEFDFSRALSALREIQQYRAIGTVEEFSEALENVKTLSRMYEKISDQEVDEYLKLSEYEKIGTVEECLEARERQSAKKPNRREDKYTDLIQHYSCPVCGRYFGQAGRHNVILFDKPKYCSCGQKLDWSE